jgi:hypothetical protein
MFIVLWSGLGPIVFQLRSIICNRIQSTFYGCPALKQNAQLPIFEGKNGQLGLHTSGSVKSLNKVLWPTQCGLSKFYKSKQDPTSVDILGYFLLDALIN